MRVRVDRGGHTVHLELSDTAITERKDVAEGVTVTYDAAGRIVGVAVRGVDPAALSALSIDLADVQTAGDARPVSVLQPAAAARPLAPPPPPAFAGPVGWDSEAEAAMEGVPFFRRGPTRLAAIALTRRRGLSQVTLAVLNDAKAGAAS